MKKVQKIWLWVAMAMFIIPELFWSPICNFLYSLLMPTVHGSSQILRDNFLLSSQYNLLYQVVLLIQLIGSVIFTIIWIHSKSNLESKSVFWVVSILACLLALINLFVVYMAYAIGHMSLL